MERDPLEPARSYLEQCRGWRPFTLIQRLEDPRRGLDPSRGFDGFFSFDYMGRAEFEFGTVQVALQSMRQDLFRKWRKKKLHVECADITVPEWNSYGPKETTLFPAKAVPVYFVSREPLGERASELEYTLQDEYGRTKEHTNMGRAVNEPCDTVAWWSLANDIAWALDSDYAERLIEAFNTLKE